MPAPPMPFLPPEVHGKLDRDGDARLRRRRRGRRAGAGAVPRARRAARRHGAADALPGMYPPEDPDYRPVAAARTDVRRRTSTAAETIVERSRPRTRRGGSPSCACWAARWRACRRRHRLRPPRRAHHGQRRRDLRRPRRRPGGRGAGSTSSAADYDGDGAYVSFLGDEGEARVRAAYPGGDLGAARRGQGRVRPRQPVPAQPER